MNKREFVYPGTDLDRGKNLLNLLGSFWADLYTAKDQTASYVTSTALELNQTYKNLLETLASISHRHIPVFHNETLTPIVLRESELNSALTNIEKFDRQSLSTEVDLQFDVPPNSELYAFPLKTNLARVGYLFNKITFPTATLTTDIDFVIDRERQAIIFARNPFETPAFLRQKTATDVELTLWGFSADYDYDYVLNQFGYALGITLRSSEGYRELTSAVFSALVDGGASSAGLDRAISAITGIPTATEFEKVVEITRDRGGVLIITDKTVYRFQDCVEPVVVIGQELRPGDYLIRGFEIIEFFDGRNYSTADDDEVLCTSVAETLLTTNQYETLTTETDDEIALTFNQEVCARVRPDLNALTLDRGMLAACFWGDLVFENKEVPLEIDENHPSGYTYVKFSVGGFPADVERFFDEIHLRGIAALETAAEECPPVRVRGTLAQVLDNRKNSETEPTRKNLPKTINPLQFLIENVLRNNVFVVRIMVSALGPDGLGLYNIRHLRALIPPQTAMIVVFEITPTTEHITPEYLSEDITYFTGAEPRYDTVPHTLVRDYGPSLSLISLTCQ